MKTIEQMLRSLARSDVAELAVVSDRLPCVKVEGGFQPIDDAAPGTDAILQMLVSAGGSRYVDSLGPKPVQWSTRVEGVGPIAVSAMMRDDVVQARFKLLRREARPAPEPPSSRGVALDPGPSLELDMSRGPVAAAPPPLPVASTYDAAPDLAQGPALDVPSLEALSSAVRPAPSAATKVALAALLDRARAIGASDLHVIAGRPPLYRVAGELTPDGGPLAEAAVEEAARALVPARLAETLERDGSCDFALVDARGRCRVNVARQRTGYKICARLVPPDVPTLAALGLPEAIGGATRHHQGLILVTGPTGHGKTATLAAIVDLVNRETTHHVITVEDPIEYVHQRKRALMSQREVGAHTRSFSNALKAALREDPDVIVVGELRDTETVRMALSASETGHLVLGTMNTPSAAKTIDRLIDLFPPGDQAQVRMTLAGGLRLIVSQRLIPNVDRTGLVAAAEVLPGSISLWSLIRDNKTFQIPSLQQRGKGLGITRFDDSLAELVKAGRTTLEIAKPWAESPEELELTVTNRRPPVVPPLAAPPPGGILNKAGSLFRKGG